MFFLFSARRSGAFSAASAPSVFLPHGAAGGACFSLSYKARRSAAMAKTHEMWRFGTNARKCGIW